MQQYLDCNSHLMGQALIFEFTENNEHEKERIQTKTRIYNLALFASCVQRRVSGVDNMIDYLTSMRN